jgi:ATP-binding cassette subfamily F protein 3
MIEATTTALQSFNGAIIIVSHNRHLLSATVDQFYLIHEGVFAPYDGDLRDYENWLQKSFKNKNQHSRISTKINFKKIGRKNSALLRAQTTTERKEINLVEEDLDKILKEIAVLDNKMTDASLYLDKNKKDLEQAILKRSQFMTRVVELERLWFELSEALDKKIE